MKIDSKKIQFKQYTIHYEKETFPRVIGITKGNNDPFNISWYDLQKIKCLALGDEISAIEIFPSKSKLVDDAHVRWLWEIDQTMKIADLPFILVKATSYFS